MGSVGSLWVLGLDGLMVVLLVVCIVVAMQWQRHFRSVRTTYTEFQQLSELLAMALQKGQKDLATLVASGKALGLEQHIKEGKELLADLQYAHDHAESRLKTLEGLLQQTLPLVRHAADLQSGESWAFSPPPQGHTSSAIQASQASCGGVGVNEGRSESLSSLKPPVASLKQPAPALMKSPVTPLKPTVAPLHHAASASSNVDTLASRVSAAVTSLVPPSTSVPTEEDALDDSTAPGHLALVKVMQNIR